MRVLPPFSHQCGVDILTSPRFAAAFDEFRDVLGALPCYRAPHAKQMSAAHVVAPAAMNDWLTYELCTRRDWEWHPLTDGRGAQLRSDFRKARIEVEVQFGNIARYAYDLVKMGIAIARERAEVGLLVVPTRRFADVIGSNLAHFERVVREVRLMPLAIPLVVLGIEPECWDVRTYPAADEAPRPRRATGRQLVLLSR